MVNDEISRRMTEPPRLLADDTGVSLSDELLTLGLTDLQPAASVSLRGDETTLSELN